MKKKIYFKPEIAVVPINMNQSILAGSDPDITTNLVGLEDFDENGFGLFAD
jgi:hypothetical protein